MFGDDYRYQIWNLDGQLLLSNFGLASAAAMAPLHASGFTDLKMDNDTWRVYTLKSIEEGKFIQVAERSALRSALPLMMDASMAGIVALSLMLVLWPTLRLVRRLVRPLEELAAQFVRRHPLDLAPVSLSQASRDLDPVVDAVNDLFARAQRAMQIERGFTAMAAHELRTPLATLRALSELLAQTDDEAERRRLIDDLVATSDRCTHLQEQLLTLARLDLVESGGMHDELLLADVVTEVQEELLPDARARQIKLAARLDATEMHAHRFGVRTLVRNLVSNSLRHTPPGGRVEVSTRAEGRDAIIEVHDSGIGIPEAERQRVFERFVRLSPHQGNGVGLGLSIVRTVADAHQAEVRLGESPMGGLSVAVRFPDRLKAGVQPD